MKKKKIFNLLIIDASGSMRSKVPEVEGGVNQIIDDLKKEAKADKTVKNRISIVDFSAHNDIKTLYSQVKAKELKKLKPGDYTTRGSTALFDAIGKSFNEVPDRQDGVLVTIFTDGRENDSKEFTEEQIKKLITAKEEAGWTVTFMGTTQEAMMAAGRMGVKSSKQLLFENSKDGVMFSMKALKHSRTRHKERIKEGLIMSLDDPFQGFENLDDTRKEESSIIESET